MRLFRGWGVVAAAHVLLAAWAIRARPQELGLLALLSVGCLARAARPGTRRPEVPKTASAVRRGRVFYNPDP